MTVAVFGNGQTVDKPIYNQKSIVAILSDWLLTSKINFSDTLSEFINLVSVSRETPKGERGLAPLSPLVFSLEAPSS